MKPLFTLFVFVSLFTFMACGPKVYTAPNAASATAAHSLIAIIPPVVNIKGRKKDDPATLKAAADADVFAFQQEMFSWMLRRKQQGKIIGVEIMDPETVNAKLEKVGYTIDSRSLTPKELAEALGVDAVITSKFNTSKPMSEGAAVALGVLFGAWGTTNETTVSLSLHDPQEGMLWNYDWVAQGSLTSTEALVNNLMRNASRRMPYVVQ